MKIMIFFSLLLCGCATTKFVEKTSEPMSQTIYAAKDGADLGRFDLSSKYLDKAVLLIPPPKERIKIDPIYEN